jgi:hypothetical protein
MPLPRNYDHPTYASYIRSPECFYDELTEREAELILLSASLAIMQAESFSFLEHTADPVIPRIKEAYVPTESAARHERQAIASARVNRMFALHGEYGDNNVWLGPPMSSEPAFPELGLSEQRGFWVRTQKS